MPINRFAPQRIVTGREQSATVLDRILQSLFARWPAKKCDIESVFSAAIDWSDGAMVPTENLNLEEIFNSATDIAQALGCLDFLNGLTVNYIDDNSISVSPGHCFHRGEFKRLECDSTTNCATIAAAGSLVDLTEECAPVEGNPSGLDSDMWYFVYIKLDAPGATPSVSELIRVSAEIPVICEGKGWEHPNFPNWRFIGSIRTMDTGVIRPFDRYNNGWVKWRFSEASDDYTSIGAGDVGTDMTATSGSWVRYRTLTTTSAYHDGDKHISPTADSCRVVLGSKSGDDVYIKAVYDPDGCDGYKMDNGGDDIGVIELPVNPECADDEDKQTFFWKGGSGGLGARVDVTAYHERLQ